MNLVEKVIEQLGEIRKRPGMYFQENVSNAEDFLEGMRTALGIAGVPLNRQSHQRSFERRGWTWTSLRAVPSMREKGLSNDQILDELMDALMDELRYCHSAKIKDGTNLPDAMGDSAVPTAEKL